MNRALFFVAAGFLGTLAVVPAQTVYPQKLNGTLAPSEDVFDFQVSPDGDRVVYRLNKFRIEVGVGSEVLPLLFSVPLQGGPSVLLSPDLPFGAAGVDLFFGVSYRITPDGSRVVYLADRDVIGRRDLYSVPIGGGTSVKLNGDLVAGGKIISFQLSPDSSRVVYRAEQNAVDVQEIFSVPVGGGAAVPLNEVLPSGGDVGNYLISPDSSRVVYHADQDTDNLFELYSVSIAGGKTTRLNGALTLGGDVDPVFFAISPDSSRVAYLADQVTDEVDELFSARLRGGSVTKLSGFLTSGGDAQFFRISPVSNRVVFKADAGVDEQPELFSTPLAGGSRSKLNGALPPSGKVFGFEISPDGSQVVYDATQDTTERSELYAVSIEGGTPRKISVNLVGGGGVSVLRISPDSERVVYRQSIDGDFEVFSVSISGGPVTRLNGSMAPGGNFSSVQVSPDSQRVLYRADQDLDERFELYSVPILGGFAAKLNGPLVPGGDVNSFAWRLAPDESRVVYVADQDRDDVVELYVGKAQSFWRVSAGSWFSTASWTDGVIPNPLVEAVISAPAVAEISSGQRASAELLVLGGGAGSSIVDLRSGAKLTLEQGADIQAGGVIRGDGVLSMEAVPLDLPAGAEVRVAEGQRLAIQSGSVSNGGRIEALGRAPQPAEVEFAGEVTNEAGTGAIVGGESTLRFQGSLQNNGSLSFASGLNNVFGDVVNQSGGLVTVSGGAVAVFFEDVNNGGAINVSEAGGLPSTAVFLGALAGNGVGGGGRVFIEGDARPGFSPGSMEFGGDLTFGTQAELEIDLAGPLAGTDYDQLSVARHLELGGMLTVNLLGDFAPKAGMVFDLFEAASVSGQFASVDLPPLSEGLSWHLRDLPLSGELRVALVPESYAEFTAIHGLRTAPDGDEEGDGVLNLFEYLAGRDPLRIDTAGPFLEVASVGSSDSISFLVANPGGRDVTVEVETSTTLRDGGPGGWRVIATRVGTGPWTGDALVERNPGGDGLERISATVSNRDPKRFYRLKVHLIP